MKLEGELTFFQSKMGVEPESQSFEFNDSDQNSAGYKLQNQKVKEYENKVSVNSKKKEWGLDRSPYDMVSADCMTMPKLEFYNSMIDLKNDHEAQVMDLVEPKSHSSKDKRGLDPSPYGMESAACMSTPKLEFYDSMIGMKNDYEAQVIGLVEPGLVEPVSHSSKDIESFMKFPNDKESVKKSPTSPMSNPLKEIDTFENSVEVYMDKTVTECEPELVVCYKENNYHVVKDICVDEGVLTNHKVMFEVSADEKAYNFVPSVSFENEEKQKDNTGIEVLNLPATEKSDQVSDNHDQPNDLMHKDEEVTENPTASVSKELDKGKQVCSEPELHSKSAQSKNMVEEAVLAGPILPLEVDESPSEGVLTYHFGPLAPADCGKKECHQLGRSKNMVEEAVLAGPALPLEVDESNSDSTLTYHFGPSAPADCGKNECHQLGGCICSETQHTDHGVTSQVRHSLGESSFSAVGPVSSRISYSGSIPYSGSISIRSDSSTTSTRSFAFPVMQPEWNSSPVRMAKADRSHYRKHRGWRQGLLCCRF